MARFWEIDFFRAIAVLMMIIFHSLFYIDYFGFADFNLYSGFIGRFQMLIPLIFLTVSGISSSIQSRIYGKKALLSKGLKLLGISLIITTVTFFLFPDDFVFFGIIHLIAFSTIISYFLINEKFALILGTIILFLSPWVNRLIVTFKYLSIFGFKYSSLSTFDYYPLIPWSGIFFIGYYMGLKFYKNKKPKNINNRVINFVCLIGRNSLLIYFVHIVLLFGFFYFLRKIFP